MTTLEVATRIEIAALADRVWSMLLDFDSYPRWNPFMRAIEGTPRPGTRLHVTMQTKPAANATICKLEVRLVAQALEFCRAGTLGYEKRFRGEHDFFRKPLPASTTVLAHGERFCG